jgi:hypothetical protein
MSAMVTTVAVGAASPRLQARVAGVFYLLTFLLGGATLLVGGGFVVPGDAAATAAKILAHETSFRLGIAVELLVTACYVAVTALFYRLFKPVSRTISLLAAFFSLVGCAIGALSCVFKLAPLAVLGGAPYLNVFNGAQLRALALVSFKLYTQVNSMGLVFFGFYCLLIGYLILRSTFLPRALGVLMMFGGLGWLTFLPLPLASDLYPYNLAPGILGEGALTLWLLVLGVNLQRWQEQASASPERST